ncbi:AtpZ/AtpI family protein [Pseudorhodoplanes sp.]|uniref:AtpZ/AtpI family protein n=1 Tax=Pseudorhodoplanes sp. TaxID=1934341 RepID=UPI00391C4F86
MADGARGKDERSADRASEEAAFSERLKGLGARLGQTGQAKPAENDSGKYVSDPQAMAKGFRLSAELVAGVLVGALIGWFLDRLTGLSPWGMIVFLLLGFAAGVLNVMRAAGVVGPSKLPGGNADKP